jgi:uncharacterized protein YjiS (DUF1127 family)
MYQPSDWAFRVTNRFRRMKMIVCFHPLSQNIGQSLADATAWPTAIARMLRDLGDAFRQGLAAHREYERLKSSGMCHDLALGISLRAFPSQNSHRQGCCPRPKSLSLGPLSGRIGAWIECRRERRALAQLDERLLRDVGLTRSQDGVRPLSFAGRHECACACS